MNKCNTVLGKFFGISINPLATPGCVNPPTVSCVEDIAKFASPLTVYLRGNKKYCKYVKYVTLMYMTITLQTCVSSPWVWIIKLKKE